MRRNQACSWLFFGKFPEVRNKKNPWISVTWALWHLYRWQIIVHDDVIKWKHFPRYWPFVQGIHRSPVNSPHKGQWREALMFSLICAWKKRLSKQSWGWWFETPSRSLWRHCNGYPWWKSSTHQSTEQFCNLFTFQNILPISSLYNHCGSMYARCQKNFMFDQLQYLHCYLYCLN